MMNSWAAAAWAAARTRPTSGSGSPNENIARDRIVKHVIFLKNDPDVPSDVRDNFRVFKSTVSKKIAPSVGSSRPAIQF